MTSEHIATLTQDNFTNDVLHAPTPVLVDFWAEWCGPCKMIAPIIEDLASEYDGRARFGKVNIDTQQELATQYGIRAIPTLLIFKGGEVVEQMVGLRSKRDLKANLDKYTLD
ncbi:MAG: thioredoxin [Verrucomicrobia bacterium]|nr:thioredoxin [Verrucomicrobiota bacterium]